MLANRSTITHTLSAITLALLLTGCNTAYKRSYNTAQQLYTDGQYSQVVSEIHAGLNSSKFKLSNDMINLIKRTIKQLESTINTLPSNQFDERIGAYKQFYEIIGYLQDSKFNNSFAYLHPTYTQSAIKQKIAQQYYYKGSASQGTDTSSYEQKAIAYETGLQYGFYKDMAELAKKYRFLYAQSSAETYYQEAKQYINTKEYKAASSNLILARNAYSQYGIYKDTEELFLKYDPIWRKEQAIHYHEIASNIATIATTARDYEEVYNNYNEAYSIYSTYGNYRNSKELAAKYYDLWQQAVAKDHFEHAERLIASRPSKYERRQAAEYYDKAAYTHRSFSHARSLATAQRKLGVIKVGYNLTNIGSSELSSLIKRQIEGSFSYSEFEITNLSNDFDIRIGYNDRVDDNTYVKSNDHKEGYNHRSGEDHPDGQHPESEYYSYYEKTTVEERVYRATVSIDTTGWLGYYSSFDLEATSSIKLIECSGNDPFGMCENKTEGDSYNYTLKSESQLQTEIYSQIGHQLSEHLSRVRDRALSDL